MRDRRQEVLNTLRSSDAPMSIVDIAHRLGVHPNTVRFHLRVLADSGRVESVEPTRETPGRPPLMYRAHRGMDPAGPRNYRMLAGALASRMAAEPDSTEKAIDAGRLWGDHMVQGASNEAAVNDDEATDRLVEILHDVGFAPERRSSSGATQIGLRHCPFLDLVPAYSAVICPMHLGLMQGVMKAVGASSTVERLEPFVEPDLCLAHVGTAAAS